ncbi:hypothetical protein ACFW9D_23730 [Streptomyces sp. NPDC059524]|uniref:hypothetical protein n=1 Tax=Streptomyces sp. NPDC059524 TaxID=3346856 RepID=UPI0036760370
MSRETDSSSSGPQGRGAAAYPSGTPPYGTSARPGDAGPTPPGDEGTDIPDAPKTETTLTTRIRINIPGSRPIPPVVMRTPMSDADGKPKDGGEPARTPAAAPADDASRPSALASYAASTTDSASAAAPAGAPQAPAEPEAQRETPREEKKTSDWFAPRKAAPAASASGDHAPDPEPQAPRTPEAPRDGGSSGGFDVTGAIATGPLGSSSGPRPQAPGDRGDLPFFSGGQDSGGRGPAGPTTGPVSGDGPMITSGVPDPAVPGAGTAPRMSDDTAILTPQKPAPEPGPSAQGGHVSGDTLTSGIPRVPAAGGPGSPFAPPTGGQGPAPTPFTPPKLPDPVPAQSAPAKKKGRNKLVLIGAGVVGLAGVAYGAGLLMNHSDVPKGTTVLGVDIGGGTRDEAAAKLETALGARTDQALKLSVDGKTVELKPDQAGLSLDSAATVSAAAGSDYNPVSVIGSLFGGERVVDPVMPVDNEKLAAALERAAGGAAASGDGTIRFEPGKAVAVYGKTGKGIDVDKSTAAVSEAYRAQVETGASGPVQVPTTTRQPTVPNAEVDRKMKQFAEPAMSGLITIKAGSASIPFGPDKSLPKILGMKAVDGKLVETYDLKALKELYGNTFDGVLITRGTGKKTPVTPQDVAQAMGRALLGKTAAERVVEIDTNPT